jgi:two-component system, OmpR family, alkaline phosphatase synthesis response regulator PhoP
MIKTMNRPLKVLVVDDEPDIVEILSYNLAKENFEVSKAYNGYEAVSYALKNHPDLIIMDIRMPEMNGIEACRMIKKNELMKNIPVLFLTADNDEYASLSAVEAGGDHFVTKPVRPAILIGMIRELVGSSE